MVRPFLISVDLTNGLHPEGIRLQLPQRSALFKSLGIEATLMGVGVDRVDYTKGIPERFLAIDVF
jgi:trehalose 6-phosphate synthase